jgi:TorA maturation chaperone TorD
MARECLYRFLAVALSDPQLPHWRFVLDQENQRLACAAADLLRTDFVERTVQLGFAELPPQQLSLEPVVSELLTSIDEQSAEYDRVFGLVLARECPPYETEYDRSSETFFRSQQLADIAGFYRAFGLEPSHVHPERSDYLPLELEFMAFLLMKKRLAMNALESDPAERVNVCEEAECNFFREHLARWVPAFASGLRRKAERGLYAELARVLATLIPAERHRLGVNPPRAPVQAELIERPEEQSGCANCHAGS